MEHDFTIGNHHSFNSWGKDLETLSPLHDEFHYKTDGEIIVAHYPEYYYRVEDYHGPSQDPGKYDGLYSGDGPYFFVCREGATMNNAYHEEVPQVVDVNPDGQPDLYQCNPDHGMWVPISECQSGLDHDGDGKIDNRDSWYHTDFNGDRDHDPNCLEPHNDKTETCPNVAIMSNVGFEQLGTVKSLVAQYYDSDAERCNTDFTIQQDDEDHFYEWREEPYEFLCQDLDFITSGSICDTAAYSSFGSDEMPAVRYYAEREYFDHLAEEQGRDLYDDGVYTDFVGPDGWRAKEQTLWNAEQRYSEWSQEHNQTAWKQRGLANVEEAYLDDETSDADPSTNIQAWTVANAGADNNEVSSTGDHGEDSIFHGGFHGKCPIGEEWAYDDSPGEQRWRCGGFFDWEQPVMLPEITSSGESTNIGLIIMHTNLEHPDWIDPALGNDFINFPEAGPEDFNEELESFDAKCWAGEPGDKPDEGETHLYFEVENRPVNSDSPFGVYGEVDMTDHSQYTCTWSFTTDKGTEVEFDGDLVQMHWSDDTLESEFPGEGERLVNTKQAHLDNIPGLETSYSSSEFAEQMQHWGISAAN